MIIYSKIIHTYSRSFHIFSEHESNDTTVRVNVASGILSCSVYVGNQPFSIDPTLAVEYNNDVSVLSLYDNNGCLCGNLNGLNLISFIFNGRHKSKLSDKEQNVLCTQKHQKKIVTFCHASLWNHLEKTRNNCTLCKNTHN